VFGVSRGSRNGKKEGKKTKKEKSRLKSNIGAFTSRQMVSYGVDGSSHMI
jgi:hypothetical protein